MRPTPYGDRDGGMAAGDGERHRAVPSAAHRPPGPVAEPLKPMIGMDMASLCVAVLGVWLLGAVLSAALTRRRGPIRPPLLTVAAVTRPAPPPGGPDLAALAVLRI